MHFGLVMEGKERPERKWNVNIAGHWDKPTNYKFVRFETPHAVVCTLVFQQSSLAALEIDTSLNYQWNIYWKAKWNVFFYLGDFDIWTMTLIY